MAHLHRLVWLLFPAFLPAATVHYDVKLKVDLANHTVQGRESVRFAEGPGVMSWDKPAGVTIASKSTSTGTISVADSSIIDVIAQGRDQLVEFEYSARETKGLHWLTKQPGVFTTFYCNAWMICSMAPGQQATLRLEIVLMDEGYRAAGPGVERKSWSDDEGRHWVFETPVPVQTYLFSFAVAQLQSSKSGALEILAPAAERQSALKQTEAAVAFFREKTGINPVRKGYRQVFLPQAGLFGQEAAQLALMTELALSNLETKADVVLMAHELAHQWWGVSIGIRSWSDSWLNEGVAEYVSLLYLEHVGGREPFLNEIEKLKTRFKELTSAGPDRPLHFEGWQNEADALGQLPYVKGALFLDELRSKIGDESFWKAMARYSQQNEGKLVDSADFQRAFQETSNVDLKSLFRRRVYGAAE
jgi:aminopeptidase N